MINRLQYLDTVEYDHFDTFGNEDIPLESMELGYKDGYIMEAIEEVSERMMPVFGDDLWSGAPEIKEFIDEGIRRDLTIGSREVEEIFAVGYKLYYEDIILDNLSRIAVNYMVRFIDSELVKMVEKGDYSANLEYIENELEKQLKEDFLLDNSITYERLRDIATEIIEDSKL